MRILVDENIPHVTVQELRDAGHDVREIRGSRDEGKTDDVVWKRAQSERRILITTDKGFSRRRHRPHRGILVVRLKQPNRRKIHERVMTLIARYRANEWRGLLVNARDLTVAVWRRGQQRH